MSVPPSRFTSIDPVDNLLSRLEGVRKSHRGHIARCPAHADRTASLSVSAGDDRRALLRCFAGCEPLAIVRAIGLELADLFPTRLRPQTPEERASAQRAARENAWGAALGVLARESTAVLAAARMIERNEPLDAADRQRLAQSVALIQSAKEVLS